MGPRNTGTLGNKAEQRALQFLVSEGLTPVTRNFRRRGGEIDLIMMHGNCLTFIEVRYRVSAHYSSPATTVDHRKQQKLIRTAAMYLAGKRCYARNPVRFDVVAITGGTDDTIEWIQDAFRPLDSTL